MTVISIVGEAEVPSESELIARAARGDLPAFESLYRSNAPRVQAFCRRMTGNEAETDEMVQEVFFRAWQRIGQFESRARLSTWLCQIAANLSFDEARKRQRRQLVPLDTEQHAGREAPSSPQRLDLERAIDSLPEGARRVLVMHDVYGYRHEEIAEISGLSVGTSKSQLHRARLLLREALQP
jgi:RNA polymerase sigma-70 factor (ECF subfamily)